MAASAFDSNPYSNHLIPNCPLISKYFYRNEFNRKFFPSDPEEGEKIYTILQGGGNLIDVEEKIQNPEFQYFHNKKLDDDGYLKMVQYYSVKKDIGIYYFIQDKEKPTYFEDFSDLNANQPPLKNRAELVSLIFEKAREHRYFSILIAQSPDSHTTPIICHLNEDTGKIEILISDSVSTLNPRFIKGFRRDLEHENFVLYETNFTRQADSYSCRIDALILAKRALVDLKEHPDVWQKEILRKDTKLEKLPRKWSLSFQINPDRGQIKEKYILSWERYFNRGQSFSETVYGPYTFTRFSYYPIKMASLFNKIIVPTTFDTSHAASLAEEEKPVHRAFLHPETLTSHQHFEMERKSILPLRFPPMLREIFQQLSNFFYQ